ncbi:MAG: glycosyltransferase family 9 protein [bacterium]
MSAALLRLRQKQDPRILIVRNDGLGDFILTLPLIASLKAQWPGCHVTVLVHAALIPLIPLLPDIDAAIPDAGVLLKRHEGLFSPREREAGNRQLESRLRGEGFDAALVVYAEAATASMVRRAGIPFRAGPLRRLFFWRFNAPFRASRKASSNPEYQLNLGYLPLLGLRPDFQTPRLLLPPPPMDFQAPFAVIHPHKRSGTALTWPMENQVTLVRELVSRGLAVRIVGDEADRPVLEQWFGAVHGAQLHIGLPLPELTALIAGARVFIGNSSGPLHLAGLTGTPHVAFYPQNRVSAPARWRTLPHPSAPEDFRRYLLASEFPVGCVTCQGERCPHFNCVASIGTATAMAAVEAWGSAGEDGGGKSI